MSDDAIPGMEAEAVADAGISNAENVVFKTKITSTLELSDVHIGNIMAATGSGNVKNRASMFLAKSAAQQSPRHDNGSNKSTPKRRSLNMNEIQANLSADTGKAKMTHGVELSGDRIDDIMTSTGRGNVKNRASIFLSKAAAASPQQGSTPPNRRPSTQEKSSEESSPTTLATVFASVEAEATSEESTSSPHADKESAPLSALETPMVVPTDGDKGDEDEEDEEDEDFGDEEDLAAVEQVRKSIQEAHLIEEQEQLRRESESNVAELTTPVKKLVKGKKTLHECPFTFPFDKNGAIYWIGSEGGSKEYENPQNTGLLYVEISTLYRGKLENLTSYSDPTTSADRIAAATYTNNSSKSWVIIDFGPERSLRPAFYCLKHGASGKSPPPVSHCMSWDYCCHLLYMHNTRKR